MTEQRINAVRITAYARLHFGFLSLGENRQRRFGSFGLAIDAFHAQLDAVKRNDARLVLEGINDAKLADRLERLQRTQQLPCGATLTFRKTIPLHQGFGSGTQHALACATALQQLNGMPANAALSAQIMGRCRRSGIGLYAFQYGGFIIDKGITTNNHAPPALSVRSPLPKAWRILLFLDDTQTGMFGDAEKQAFSHLTPPKTPLNRTLAPDTAAAIDQHQFDAFTQNITQLQNYMIAAFAPMQNQRPYRSTDVATILQRLHNDNKKGYGQSSWGPTGFAFFPNQHDAQQYAQTINKTKTLICQARNKGADITITKTQA